MFCRVAFKLVAILFLLCACGSPASAQVLIWSIPQEDGAWIRFEGTYRQTQSRPNSATGDQVLEFKSVTKPAGVDKAPGPGGVYLYKVLIPEESVIGKPIDDATVPVTFIPVLEGLRKVGDRDIETVTENALAVYPHIAPVTYYPDLAPAADAANEVSVAGETYAARVFKGSRLLQDKRSRSRNAATLWLADKLPFGLAKFTVAVERDQKLPTAPADDFKRAFVTDVEMLAVETGTSARSAFGGVQ